MAMTCVRVLPGGRMCGGEIEDGICGLCGKPQHGGQFRLEAAPATVVRTCVSVLPNGAVCGGDFEEGFCASCGKPQSVAPEPAAAPVSSVAPAAPTPPPFSLRVPAAPTAPQPVSFGQVIAQTRRGSRRQTARVDTRRELLGGGLVTLAPQPRIDPERLIMETPEVPLLRRRCPRCDAQVYRMSGFCGQCATPYDFRPALKVGDMLARKYEIKGAIAFGGMGWIYLGWDTILNRWIVIKGLLNSVDEEAAAAALAERRFLAGMRHGKIVSIYDFVAQGAQGYIVMEFVGGRATESIRQDRDIVDVFDLSGQKLREGVRRDQLTPEEEKGLIRVVTHGVLTPQEGISYILGILPAFRHLHAQGYVYCDFKAENLMLDVDDVKLVDLGAVRRVGDQHGSIFGTDGFCSKDGAENPTQVSDIYSIGRTLAYLLMDFLYKSKLEEDKATQQFSVRRMIVKRYVDALPTPEEQPLLAQHDSLYRFLLRATHEDPDHRFQTVEEMEGQLFGVLREISARESGPKPAESQVFGADRLVDGADRAGVAAPLYRLLPQLRLSVDDSAASDILALASVADPTKRIEGMAAVIAKNSNSVEAKLRYADALIDAGMYPESLIVSDGVLQRDEFEWRAHWYAGKALLADKKPEEAKTRFDRVYFEMPGELAPKLGLAFACEAARDYKGAADFYGRVVMVDPAHASACFGLARCLTMLGEIRGAVDAYNAIPPSHSMYSESRLALARFLVEADHGAHAGLLSLAVEALNAVAGQSGVKHQLAGALYEIAARLIAVGKTKPDEEKDFMGSPTTELALRRAAEAEYREAARAAATAGERQMWVDTANSVRPQTYF